MLSSCAPLARGMGMRRTFSLLASMALAMLLVSGVAWAANQIRCPNGEGEPCVGTGRADEIEGTRGPTTYAPWAPPTW
jgi:hypothetical protein